MGTWTLKALARLIRCPALLNCLKISFGLLGDRGRANVEVCNEISTTEKVLCSGNRGYSFRMIKIIIIFFFFVGTPNLIQNTQIPLLILYIIIAWDQSTVRMVLKKNYVMGILIEPFKVTT